MEQFGHYTTPAGLLGILTNGRIWATNIKFLNDEHEYQHALNLISRILDSPKLAPGTTKPTPLLDEFVRKIRKRIESLNEYDTETIFTLSFSQETDLLSQWRGYCPGNNGYCIIFDIEKLNEEIAKTIDGVQLVACVYDMEEKEARLRGLLSEHWPAYQKALSPRAKDEVIGDIAGALSLLASHFKHPSFKEEREQRIVLLREAKNVDIKFRAGQSSLIPYIEFPARWELIKKIVIGPNANQLLAKRALEALVQKVTGVWSLIFQRFVSRGICEKLTFYFLSVGAWLAAASCFGIVSMMCCNFRLMSAFSARVAD